MLWLTEHLKAFPSWWLTTVLSALFHQSCCQHAASSCLHASGHREAAETSIQKRIQYVIKSSAIHLWMDELMKTFSRNRAVRPLASHHNMMCHYQCASECMQYTCVRSLTSCLRCTDGHPCVQTLVCLSCTSTEVQQQNRTNIRTNTPCGHALPGVICAHRFKVSHHVMIILNGSVSTILSQTSSDWNQFKIQRRISCNESISENESSPVFHWGMTPRVVLLVTPNLNQVINMQWFYQNSAG